MTAQLVSIFPVTGGAATYLELPQLNVHGITAGPADGLIVSMPTGSGRHLILFREILR